MKKRIKERCQLAARDFRYTYCCLAAGDTSCLSRADKVSIIIGITALFFYVMTGQAFADGLIDSAGDLADTVFDNELKTNVSKFAAVALGFCIVWFFACTNDDDAKRPLKWGKRILLAYIVFMLIDPILDLIDSWTGDLS